MEQHNPRLKKLIIQVVSNQLQMNDLPETRLTLDRLISEGYSNQDAKELIAAVVSYQPIFFSCSGTSMYLTQKNLL